MAVLFKSWVGLDKIIVSNFLDYSHVSESKVGIKGITCTNPQWYCHLWWLSIWLQTIFNMLRYVTAYNAYSTIRWSVMFWNFHDTYDCLGISCYK